MKCKQVEKTLAAASEPVARKQAETALHDHLSACSACQAFLATLNRQDAWLRQMGPALPPADLVERAANAAQRARRDAGSSLSLVRIIRLAWPAAALSIATAAFLLFLTGERSAEQTTSNDPVSEMVAAPSSSPIRACSCSEESNVVATRQRITAIALLTLILGSGVGIGIAIDRLWLSPSERAIAGLPRPPMGHMIERFREQLKLSDEQRGKVEAIIAESQKQFDAVHARFLPEMDQIHERSRAQIRALLTPEQATEYDRMNADFERRRGEMTARMKDRSWRKGPPGLDGPPPLPEASEVMSIVDKDRDGKITREECESSDHPFARHTGGHFDSIDLNHDGSVTLDELVKLHERMKRDRPGRDGGLD